MQRTEKTRASVGWTKRIASLCLLGSVAAHGATPEQIDFFEQRIRPVLANECYECHGPAKQKGGLRLDFRAGLLKGGDSGPALVPGDSKASLIMQSIRHEIADSEMPKKRPKLADAVIADFAGWVDQGAPDPRDQPAAATAVSKAADWEATFEARKDWWSFKPVRLPTLPAVTNGAWSDHPVDRFLLAKMEERGLEPAASADRRTLIRRVTFALTGLPPTLAEIRGFLDDAAPDAYLKVVDRLLASPRFGEHWARHWMDLVRFAETHGSEGDPDIPNAWRYRDYLVRAFNADVPWDQLIREHLAGDLLAKPRLNDAEGFNESLLGLAHFRLVEHGFNPVDTLDEQVKTIDSQIDVVTKAFQGLTVSCARCHDHKFDPIGQRDYYALQGVFGSVRPTQLTIDQPERLRVHRPELETLKVETKSGLAEAWEKSAHRLTEDLLARLRSGGTNAPAIPGDDFRDRIGRLQQRVAEIDNLGREAVLRLRGVTNANQGSARPMAAWTFDGDARDSVGGLNGELVGGAFVRDGRLIVDGKGAYLRTAPLDRPLREKTLEIWVASANLDQRGGGVITVQSEDGAVFDSIVFAEKEPRRWVAGSDGFRRSRNLDGPAETAAAGALVHLVAVYRTNHSIALFRDGAAYGAAYTPSGDGTTLRTFEPQSARVLLGMRHTGGGSPFFAGEIEEARLYDRALEPDEVAASFRAGPGLISPDAIAQALTPDQRAVREGRLAEIADLRRVFAQRYPDYAERDAERIRQNSAFGVATKDGTHPLGVWSRLSTHAAESFAGEWRALSAKQNEESAERRKSNADTFRPAWDFAGKGADGWFRYGANPPEVVTRPGEFTVQPEGERILAGLLPAGVFSHRLSERHNGVFASPRFKVSSDRISVRVVGGKGARIRLITDNYPIGQGNIFPQANLNSDAPTWITLDTAYRRDSTAYLEFATAEDVTSRDRSPAGPGGRSFFGVERVVFHDGQQPPMEEANASTGLFEAGPPASAEDLSKRIGDRLVQAVEAWRRESLSEGDRLFLDAFIRSGQLPTSLAELPAVATDVLEYRRLEGEIPLPRRVPGVMEGTAYDAPLLSRGDHRKPMDPVPRGYLPLIDSHPYATQGSGRLELANDIADPGNPLTSRVLVNRIWHCLFGRGLVGTVDNFGRLGETPSHPELLDFLALRFIEHGWSSKELIRCLVTTRAYQLSSTASERAGQVDPSDEWLSHARVRRLEAESIRDSLLAISGRLDSAMFGPGSDALAPPAEQRRRSVYLTVKRNFPSPFLETFDAPKPFTTLGQRDATNVPAQSLALLNDPFVVEQAAQWAVSMLGAESDPDARVRRMFEIAFARPPDDGELALCRTYLDDLAKDPHGGEAERVWRDFGQSLFNLKEFIYLR
jgi:hypothetical protein